MKKKAGRSEKFTSSRPLPSAVTWSVDEEGLSDGSVDDEPQAPRSTRQVNKQGAFIGPPK